MTSQMVSKKWLVTGASQGLGLAMALSALKAGHKVLAGARNPEKAAAEHPELETAGGKWLKLDVSSLDTQQVVSQAIEAFGGIDVVVNNAGYFQSGTIEDLTYVSAASPKLGQVLICSTREEEMQAAISTQYLGPIRVLKGALPTLRTQNAGTIVLNSGIFGLYPCPAGALYNSSKAAIDMVYETLKLELAPFNIRTITINAGLQRTGILTNGPMPKNGIGQHYLEKTPVGAMLGIVGGIAQDPGQMPGDPTKFGDRVVEIVDGTGYGKGLEKVARFIFGRDGLQLAAKKLEVLGEEVKASQKIALSIDVDGCSAPGVAGVAEF
ncbi:hypothetical protein H2198_001037 [Neophaeococcomyces mojaviensis]|uniref:Uncharacterized protein n=1 Tax=Neophaeococcomyces mojaviensis TaxID=3383035 RepID=A0ACC3AIN0_9EURO|nr:hypothetical protein H2198_001037 [Knufia sp. JES_112]